MSVLARPWLNLFGVIWTYGTAELFWLGLKVKGVPSHVLLGQFSPCRRSTQSDMLRDGYSCFGENNSVHKAGQWSFLLSGKDGTHVLTRVCNPGWLHWRAWEVYRCRSWMGPKDMYLDHWSGADGVMGGLRSLWADGLLCSCLQVASPSWWQCRMLSATPPYLPLSSWSVTTAPQHSCRMWWWPGASNPSARTPSLTTTQPVSVRLVFQGVPLQMGRKGKIDSLG